MVGYLLSVVAAYLALVVVYLPGTAATAGNLALLAGLLACAAVCGEASRRLGEAAGLTRDLQSVWTLPIALLLPPVFALLAPVALRVMSQLQRGRSLLYRQVMTAAALGLAHLAASEAFHRLLPGGGVRGALLESSAQTIGLALGCAVLCYAANALLVTTAVRLSSPEVGWRQLLLDRESLLIDGADVCMGVVVFAAWVVSPLLVLVLLVPAVLLQRALTYVQLRTAAHVDPKTGLLNPGAWQQEAERELSRSARGDRPLAVLMIDLDHFKVFNDSYGHLAGDRALLAVAGALGGGLRLYDKLGRFGGEEFSVMLPNTDAAEARHVAERLRRSVADLVIAEINPSARLTISVGGVSGAARDADLTDLLAAADHALYQAKAAGRDRVVFAPGLRTAGAQPSP